MGEHRPDEYDPAWAEGQAEHFGADDEFASGGDGSPAPTVRRADLRRMRRDVIDDDAPREGVDIIRPVEHAVIVGVQLPGITAADVDASLDELERLLDTAGATVVERVVQRRDSIEPATYLGRGKAGELSDIARQAGADAVVFDDDLSPAQQRTLEEIIRHKVLDRTIVILDIFAQHAASREGKAQVELAQLSYLLPRLRGWGDALSRQAGGRAAGGAGIGSRGPGETQLEVDRRRIMRRMTKLRRDLADVARIRSTKGAERERRDVQTVALVGYTNAGKSSLLNRLTGSDVLVADQLFATLDATARRLVLNDGRNVVVTDTVGFVAKLPHGLVEAFKSTLEQSASADLLLHVVDASHPAAEAQIVAVHEVLDEIGADQVPEQIVLNKIDHVSPEVVASLWRRLHTELGVDAVAVSALNATGIGALIDRIGVRLPNLRVRVAGHIPYARQDLVALAHERGTVLDERHTTTGTDLIADVDKDAALQMREFLHIDPFTRTVEAWERAADVR